jgi:hypothetical protein
MMTEILPPIQQRTIAGLDPCDCQHDERQNLAWPKRIHNSEMKNIDE